MAGLNTIASYVEWSGHEPQPGKLNFVDNYDLVEFCKEAQREDLLVILRVGPFICGERDNGGFPSWLYNTIAPNKFRTTDKSFMDATEKWLGELLPRIKETFYKNGGSGITGRVTLNGHTVEGWTMEAVPVVENRDVSIIMQFLENRSSPEVPGFFHGRFTLPPGEGIIGDTFLDPTGWKHGVAFINGINLGRYWPKKGPQVTLYLPGPFILAHSPTAVPKLFRTGVSRLSTLPHPLALLDDPGSLRA
ncbi:unnamed protein product [Ixodes persulcatus]